MKILAYALFLVAAAGSLVGGPWYTHEEGIAGGDKVKSAIALEERVYVFLRRASAEDNRDRNVPIEILRSKDATTISQVLSSIKNVYPKDYPKKLFVVIYRKETGYEEAYHSSLEQAKKADFKVQARDVIWIGYST